MTSNLYRENLVTLCASPNTETSELPRGFAFATNPPEVYITRHNLAFRCLLSPQFSHKPGRIYSLEIKAVGQEQTRSDLWLCESGSNSSNPPYPNLITALASCVLYFGLFTFFWHFLFHMLDPIQTIFRPNGLIVTWGISRAISASPPLSTIFDMWALSTRFGLSRNVSFDEQYSLFRKLWWKVLLRDLHRRWVRSSRGIMMLRLIFFMASWYI